jgi:hypothetical protein
VRTSQKWAGRFSQRSSIPLELQEDDEREREQERERPQRPLRPLGRRLLESGDHCADDDAPADRPQVAAEHPSFEDTPLKFGGDS